MIKIKQNLVTLLFFIVIALLFVGAQSHAEEYSNYSAQTTQVESESLDDDSIENDSTVPQETTIEESEEDTNFQEE